MQLRYLSIFKVQIAGLLVCYQWLMICFCRGLFCTMLCQLYLVSPERQFLDCSWT